MNDNLEYYADRARQEREAEASSTSVEAASAHRLLAIQYESQVDELRALRQQRPKLNSDRSKA